MDNNDIEKSISPETLHLEQMPFNSNKSAQNYTACEWEGEGQRDGDGEKDQGRRKTTMKENLLEEDKESMSMKDTSRWRSAALAVSWASVVGLLIVGILSFVVAETTQSSAAFGFGFDCLLDVGTSVVVIWRFTGSLGSVYSEKKERISLLFLGSLFIVAAVSIFARAIPDLIANTETISGMWLMILAGVSVFICSTLAILKFIIAKKLDSTSIQSDGYSSLAGGITALSMLISTTIIHFDYHVWYLDEIVGIVVGLLLTAYGIKLLVEVTQSSDLKISLKSCLPQQK
ncbi:transmembrane protein 163a-like isoform X2 [Lytechinus pictus]